MTDLHAAAQSALKALDQVADAMPFPVAEIARRELRAALSAPPGYKLVPIEPTPEMRGAMKARGVLYFNDLWRDVLAAAPSPQEPTP